MSDTSAPSADWIGRTLKDAFAALTAGRPAEAGDLCRRVLAAAPEIAEAHFLVGMVALELEDRRTAISAFGTVTRLRPRHGAAWAQLAWLHARSGEIAGAHRALAEAVRNPGSNPAVADLIGTASSLVGEQVQARDWFRRAVAAAPDRADGDHTLTLDRNTCNIFAVLVICVRFLRKIIFILSQVQTLWL